MCITIDGKLAIIGALYKKQQCSISDINQIAEYLTTEIEDINIVLNKVVISDFVNTRSNCFKMDSNTAVIQKIDKNYEFPKTTIDYYISELPESKKAKVLNKYFL